MEHSARRAFRVSRDPFIDPMVVEETRPCRESLEKALGRVDYADAFEVAIPQNAPREVDDLVRAVFQSAPRWVIGLLRLRNMLVKPFGLRTTFDEDPGSAKGPLIPGRYVAFFPVYERTDDHVLLGQDDRHLNYRVAVDVRHAKGKRMLAVSTAVHYNNRLGRLYFFLVRPFHGLIVPAMMRYGLRPYEA